MHVRPDHHRMQRDVDPAAGVSSVGNNDPVRVLGIFTVRSPAVVVTVLSRVPLRWVVRVSERSCGSAPMCADASASRFSGHEWTAEWRS